MVNLNVGNKWNLKFLRKIIEYNKNHKDIKVKELYGDNTLYQTGVRPADRLPSISIKDFDDYIKLATKNHILINFTINRACLGDMDIVEESFGSTQNLIEELEDAGVRYFTIYSPYLLKHLTFNKSLVEISTIHNQTNINYIAELLTLNPAVRKVCLPIYMNRDWEKIKRLKRHFPHIVFEVIVNEFCVGSGNTCIYRQECYVIQSHNVDFHYPFDLCTEYRKKNPIAWIKAPYILPEQMELYEDAGITHFKLTGRTQPDEVLLQTIRWYMNRKSPKYLHQLWGIGLPGQPLFEGKPILTKKLLQYAMPALGWMHFCDRKLCGIDCKDCYALWGVCHEKNSKKSTK